MSKTKDLQKRNWKDRFQRAVLSLTACMSLCTSFLPAFANEGVAGDSVSEENTTTEETPMAYANNVVDGNNIGDGDEGTYMPTDNTELHYITTEVFRGATANGTYEITDDKDYSWVAPDSAMDHTFAYRINYETSGEGEIEAGEFWIIAPIQVIRDENGNWADTYETSLPTEEEFFETYEEGSDSVLCYKEYDKDGDGVIDSLYIYNAVHTTVAMNGYIEIGYHTDLTTFNYLDGTELEDYVAVMGERDKSIASNKCTVDIDTSATITSTAFDNNMPTKYDTWQSSWGDAIKPEDDDEYFYIVWNVNTYVTKNISQNYSLTYDNTLTGSNGDVEIVGYNFKDGNGWTTSNMVTGQTTDQNVYASIITKHKKSDYEGLSSYTIKNDMIATLHPEDGLDPDTTASASKTYTWKQPVFNAPTGSFMIYQHGNGTWTDNEATGGSSYWTDSPKSHYSAWDGTTGRSYERYDLDTLQNGKVDSLVLTFYSHSDAYPYHWTATDPSDPYTYGQKNVTLSLESGDFFLDQFENEAEIDNNYTFTEPMDSNDYEITSIKYNVYSNHATFNESKQDFDLSYTQQGRLTFYAKIGDSDEYIEVGTYDYATGKAEIESEYVTSITSDTVQFAENANVSGWKIETSNAEYYTDMEARSYVNLKNSEKVMKSVEGKELYYVTMKDRLVVHDSEGKGLYNETAVDYDRLIKAQRSSSITKTVTDSTNNTKKKQYEISWAVDMHELTTTGAGVKSYVTQNGGTFYDLLPSGSLFDEDSVYVTADGNALDSSNYSVEIIENFKNSGRIMLIIAIDIAADKYKFYYTTIHTWDSIADYGNDKLNPVAYETGNEDIADGYYDDPTNPADSSQKPALSDAKDREWYKDLNGNGADENARFIYTDEEKDILAITSASAGLGKKVKAGIETPDSSYSYKSITSINNVYSYQLRYANTYTNKASNLVLYDSLENFTKEGIASEWRGTLEAVDITQLLDKGIDAIVYISTIEELNIDQNHDLTDTSVWQKVDENIDLSTAHAVAIDMRKTTDGEDFYLEAGGSVAAYLYMRAPETSPEAHGSYPIAYNNIYISNILHGINADQSYFIHRDYVQLRLAVVGNINIHKVNKDNESEGIKGVRFRLVGTSDYGTAVDRILKTDSNGDLQFKNVEMGTYVLTEYDSTVDWQMDYTTHIVTIGGDGKATVDDIVYEKGESLTLTNKARVHANISFKKKELGSVKSLTGAKFKLSGTSDYGNEIVKYATSTNGTVTFEDVELGTYTITEVSAPDGYIVSNTKLIAKVDERGQYTLSYKSGDTEFFETGTRSGNSTYYNEALHKFTIVKQNSYDYKEVAGVTFNLAGTSDAGTEVNIDLTTGENGYITFENLESGTYILKETNAETIEGQTNVLLDTTEHVVSIDKFGNVEISGLTATDGNNFIVVDTAIPDDVVTVIKKWNDGDKIVDHSNDLPTIHIQAYAPTSESTDSDDISSAKQSVFYETETASESGNTIGETLSELAESAKNTVSGVLKSIGDIINNANIMLADDGETTVVASGTCTAGGTWSLDGNGILTLSGAIGWSGSYSSNVPWNAYTSQIKSVVFDNAYGSGKLAYMFYRCSNLTSLDFTNFDTSKVTDMSMMFNGCTSLTTLNISNMNTTRVTSMSNMFENCKSLTELDVSNFVTTSVTNMSGMFSGVSNVKTLDVSGFYTPRLTNMASMFSGCSSVESLDLTNFNTSQVEYFSNAFSGCSSLRKLDLSSFNTSRASSFSSLFNNCSSLEEIDVSSFNTEKVTNMVYVFAGCSSLKTLDLSSWSTPKLTIVADMFSGCKNLEYLDISNFNLTKCTSYSSATNLFKDNENLRTIVLGENDCFSKLGSNTFIDDYVKKADKSIYTGAWAYENAYNHSKTLSKLSYYTGSTPGVWTWEKAGEDPSLQSYTSIKENVYTPEYDENGNVKQTPSEAFPKDGYWQKIDDSTYSYTYYVYKSDVPWYVWEEAVDGYVSSGYSIAGKTGDATVNNPVYIEDGSDTVTITNTSEETSNRTYGSLSITKTASGYIPDNANSFTFTVKLTDADGNELAGTTIYGTTPFKNGVAKISVPIGETKTITGIPTGYHYEITELETSYSLTITYENETGTILEDEIANARVHNDFAPPETQEKEKGQFSITKKLTGNDAEEMADTEFTFVAAIDGLEAGYSYKMATSSGETTYVADKDGSAIVEFKLKAEETATFTELPEGATYSVTEEAADNCIASYRIITNGSVQKSTDSNETATTSLSTAVETVEANEDAKITFTNETAVTRDLTLSKSVVNGMAQPDNSAEFEFTIKLSNLKPNQIIETDVLGRFKADQDGEAEKTVKLTNGKSITIYGLPTTTKYEITEAKAVNYNQSAIVNGETATLDKNNNDSCTLSGTVTKTDGEKIDVQWTNTYEQQYSLVVGKTVAGNTGDKEAEFEFSIQFRSERANTYYLVTGQDGKKQYLEIDENGIAKFKLSHGETLRIDGLLWEDISYMAGLTTQTGASAIKTGIEASQMNISETDYSTLGYKTTYETKMDDEDEHLVTVDVTNTNNTTIPTVVRTVNRSLPFVAVGLFATIAIILKRKKK